MDPYNTADARRDASTPVDIPAPLPPLHPQLPPAATSQAGARAGNPYAAPRSRVRSAAAFPEFADAAPAQRWMRLVAVLLDAAIIMVPTMVMNVAIASLRNPFAPRSAPLPDSVKLLLALYLIGIAVYVVVQLVMLHRNGQTLGKRLMAIRIVRSDGSRAGLGRIFLLRSLVPSLIGAIPLVGMFFALIDALFIFADDRRCLHDRFADTIVVDA
jgi:uncharacterized RDD family membrane protein YckC